MVGSIIDLIQEALVSTSCLVTNPDKQNSMIKIQML